MKKEKFNEIIDYISVITKGTEFENHVFAVGGSVRDLVMGMEIKDIDLVIDLPDGGINFANFCKENNLCKNVVIYPTYGTAMFKFHQFPDDEIECVMTRGEKYLDNGSRNPVTQFADIKEDCYRRDLTINALYYDITKKEILDMAGGVEDIENEILRTPMEKFGDVDQTFIDDPLRIMRVVRFFSKFDPDVNCFEISEQTFQAMMRNVNRLEIITKERIRDEFNKIILSKNNTSSIHLLHMIGAMKYIIPELDECCGLEQNEYHFGDVYEHTLHLLTYYKHTLRISDEHDLTCLLACLLHDIGKTKTKTIKDGRIHFYDHESVGSEMCIDILKRLKYDNQTINEVCFLVRNHMRTKSFGNNCEKMKEKHLNKLMYQCENKDRFERLTRVIQCDNMSHAVEHWISGQYEFLHDKLDSAHSKMFGYKLPITGDEIMSELGINPGPEIKMIQDKLLKQVFVNKDLTHDQCIRMLKGIYKQVKNEMEKS